MFAVPSAWRKFVLPRRADSGPLPKVQTGKVKQAAELLRAHHSEVLASLDNRGTPGDLSEAGRAYLSADPAATPLGAAVVVQAISRLLRWPRLDEAQSFADYWRNRHGLAFAAVATAELAALYPGEFGAARPITRGVEVRDVTGYSAALACRVASLLRRVVVAVDDAAYAEVVASLAQARGQSLPQRAVISVMAPDEAAWADELSAEVLHRPGLEGIKAVLCTVVTSPEAALRVAEQVSVWQVLHNQELVHTLVAGVGPAAAPALAHWLDTGAGADVQKKLLEMLTVLDTDEAFAALVQRLGRPHVQGAVAQAATRFPERAVRLLAAADTPAAARLLRNHVVNHPAAADEARPRLTGPAVERLDTVLASVRAADAGAAAPEDLPPVLVNPPWITPVVRKPLVVAGLSSDETARLDWRPGEREAWQDSSWASRHGGAQEWTPQDWARVAGQIGTPAANRWDEIYFFLRAPDELAVPLIESWRPGDTGDIGDWGRVLPARYGVAALPALLHCARRSPAPTAPVLAPFASPEVALLMAGWRQRLKSVREVTDAWFARHAASAARALVPVATGEPSGARTDAENGLRALAGAGHAGEVRTAAAAHGPQTVAAVEEVLAVDPLTELPKAVPSLPEWANPGLLPPIRLTGGRGTLPADSVRHLLTMLAISRMRRVYPGLEVARSACEPADLAELVWALFGEWREAGHPAKQSWVLDALGLLGDDETVRRLAPVIRAWPGEAGHARAVAGLDVLAEIGSDVALMYLNGIAQKVKFRGLRERASEKITELAATLGLTADELADRLVPDLGLDADGSLVLDYGRRGFTVGFDEQLKPFVADAAGKRLKALPKPGVQDDPVLAPAAYQRFSALKKDVRAIAADQVRRLERAMVDQRRWTGADFRLYLAGHPVLRHLVRRLVWARFDAAGLPAGGLRVAEDRTLADAGDETVTLADDELIGIAHPLHLGEELATWSELFADYEILQPFPQLQRGVQPLTPEQAEQRLGSGFLGVTVPTTQLLGLERRGWRRGAPQDAGVQGWFERDVPGDLSLVVEIDPGIAVGALDILPDQKITEVFLEARSGHRWHRRESASRLRELDPITAAEALRDLTEVLS